LPAGLVWAGIAKCRAASSPRGITARAAECRSGDAFAIFIIKCSRVNECSVRGGGKISVPFWREAGNH
jgi:hypothetical protein